MANKKNDKLEASATIGAIPADNSPDVLALQALNADLTRKLDEALAKLAEKVLEVPSDSVSFMGNTYRIIGDFRADNTFVEVKRGHCPEGVTLLAIDKVH